MDILVRIPFLLSFGEPVHRNTKTVELPRQESQSFSTHFYLQKLKKKREKIGNIKRNYTKKSEPCYIVLCLMFLTLLFTFTDGNAWQ
jgi:hypothetical protein